MNGKMLPESEPLQPVRPELGKSRSAIRFNVTHALTILLLASAAGLTLASPIAGTVWSMLVAMGIMLGCAACGRQPRRDLFLPAIAAAALPLDALFAIAMGMRPLPGGGAGFMLSAAVVTVLPIIILAFASCYAYKFRTSGFVFFAFSLWMCILSVVNWFLFTLPARAF